MAGSRFPAEYDEEQVRLEMPAAEWQRLWKCFKTNLL